MYIITKIVERELFILERTDTLKEAQEILIKDFLQDFLQDYLVSEKKEISLAAIKEAILDKKEDNMLYLGLNCAWFNESSIKEDSDWYIINTESDSTMPLENEASEEAELWEMVERYICQSLAGGN